MEQRNQTLTIDYPTCQNHTQANTLGMLCHTQAQKKASTRHHARPQDSHHYGGELAERPTPLYPELMSVSRQSRPQRPVRPNRLSQFVSSSQARFKMFRGFVGDYIYRR